MHDIAIPLDVVLKMTTEMCSDCQSKVRQYIVANQFDIRHNVEQRMKLIMESVCEETGVTIDQMRRKDNHVRFVRARRRVAVLAREQFISYPRIAAALQKHHTTVMHLVATADAKK